MFLLFFLLMGLSIFVCTDKVKEVETFWSGCEMSRMVQELIGVYIMMEEYFMREMILKVHCMSQV